MRTWLGREIADAAKAVRTALTPALDRVAQLLRRRHNDREYEKIHALRAPEAECNGTGKARTCFKFSVKVSLATIDRAAPGGQFVVAVATLPSNSFDAICWPPGKGQAGQRRRRSDLREHGLGKRLVLNVAAESYRRSPACIMPVSLRE